MEAESEMMWLNRDGDVLRVAAYTTLFGQPHPAGDGYRYVPGLEIGILTFKVGESLFCTEQEAV